MRPLLIASLVALCGCAAAPVAPDVSRPAPPPPNHQAIAVITDPPGARCWLRQRGREVAHIASTPAVAIVPSSSVELVVECGKEGFLEDYQSFPVILEPRHMTGYGAAGVAAAGVGGASAVSALGSAALATSGVLLPLAGVALVAEIAFFSADAAEQPKPHYPPEVTLVLASETFPSEEARDAWLAPHVRRAEDTARVELEWPCERFGSSHSECIRARNRNEAADRAAAYRSDIIKRTRIVAP